MENLISNSEIHPVKPPFNRGLFFDCYDYLNRLSRTKYDSETMLDILYELADSGLLQMDRFPWIGSGYSRTILYREANGFEVMAARWSKGAKTPIHGHPGFALIYLIEGQLWEDSFEKKSGFLTPTGSNRYQRDDYSCHQGAEGRFDNSIHQITADTQSLSLHVYSDDALRGETYSL